MSSVLSYGINFCIESLALLLFVPFFPDAFRLSPALLLIPLLLLALVLALIGVALATSVLNVIYRDVAYLVNTALLLLYWLTPVIYPIQVVPEPFRSVLRWNPFGAIITALRGAHGAPQPTEAHVAAHQPLRAAGERCARCRGGRGGGILCRSGHGHEQRRQQGGKGGTGGQALVGGGVVAVSGGAAGVVDGATATGPVNHRSLNLWPASQQSRARARLTRCQSLA